MSTEQNTLTSQPTPERGVSRVGAGLTGLSAVLAVIGLTGPTWLHFAADPVAKTPALDANFGDLGELISNPAVPTTWIQEAYLGWLAWTLVAVLVILALVCAVTHSRVAALATAAVAVFALVAQLFAAKGVSSWSAFFDTIPDIRVGAYLTIASFIVAACAGFASRGGPSVPISSDS